jgi:predicted CopG family antitoxin
MHMVRVITIRDDVYDQLSELKKKNGMSFSEAIDYLLKEKNVRRLGLLEYAGIIEDSDIEKNATTLSRRWKHGNEDMP